MATITLKLGNSFDEIPKLKNIGAVVCDPPYLISFMGKSWDDAEGENLEWFKGWLQKCYDILPSGGVVKVFCATRTFHRLAQAMTLVGFQDLDLEAWVYSTGFPKSMNLSKAIDQHLGKLEEREVLGDNPTSRPNSKKKSGRGFDSNLDSEHEAMESAGVQVVTAAATEEAKRFEGWGTALKPAWEPFIVGYKP